MNKCMLLVFAASLFATVGGAQVKRSPNRGGFIIKGGVNFANITVTKSGNVDDANNLTSFHAGFAGDVPLSAGLSLQPGLLLTGKGTKATLGNTSGATFWEATSNPIYVELPVNLVGKIPLGSKALFLGVGPYAAVGVAGKNKVSGKILNRSFNREFDVDFSDDNPTTLDEENAGYGKLKRFDYGMNAMAGFDLGRIIISANYGIGFAKINSGASNKADEESKHRVLSLSLGLKL